MPNHNFLPYEVMNLVDNWSANGLLSDGATPLPDPMWTSPLWLISIQLMTQIDDENKFECIIFKMSPGLNDLKDLSGKALHVPILLTLTEGNYIESI